MIVFPGLLYKYFFIVFLVRIVKALPAKKWSVDVCVEQPFLKKCW